MSYFKGIGNKSGSYTGRKLPLIGLIQNQKQTIFNKYVPGSGVGASSTVSRRLKKQRAYNKKCGEEIVIELLKDDELLNFDDISNENDIPELIEANPSLDINLNDSTNINIDKFTILAVAQKIKDGALKRDNGEIILKKQFFASYNVLDDSNIGTEKSLTTELQENGFEVNTSYDETTPETENITYIFSVEVISNQLTFNAILIDNDIYT